MAVTKAPRHTAPGGALVLIALLGSGCAEAQSTMKIAESPLRDEQSTSGQTPKAGVLREDEAPFKVLFQCSSVVPGTIFAELSWPVASAQAFSMTTKHLAVMIEHDGFEKGSYGEISVRDVEPFDVEATGSGDRRAYTFATTLRGQSVTVRRNNEIVQRSRMVTKAVAAEPTNASEVDASLDYPTRLLAQLRVVDGAFDTKSTAPRGTVTLVGLEANVAYRFRLSDGSRSSPEYEFVAPPCITDYAGPRPE